MRSWKNKSCPSVKIPWSGNSGVEALAGQCWSGSSGVEALAGQCWSGSFGVEALAGQW